MGLYERCFRTEFHSVFISGGNVLTPLEIVTVLAWNENIIHVRRRQAIL